ncbi:V-type ATP synthase subunit D [Geomesophilobacter sediminis]|uniref:V-type ATP synthase subunit D n=1 Tax=Geomesophilobacter sediminis TaxID=2798584 RepID=A0A8J7LVL8_9BACT|nr:V-type ATP synthase subunit D [Geomesophilobacter sediminis]MBJ6725170.1 V-type ATP synthase subunit D [Geomesophilobacter sediminis]
MINPTRTNLLLLKEKARSVTGSVAILKARRLALMREFLTVSEPFLRSRDEVSREYARALAELHLACGHEGERFIAALEKVMARDLGVEIAERSVMGLTYRELTVREEPVREPQQRGYDCRATTPHLEEAIHRFERVLAEVLEIAALESKMKRLGDEIARVTRRTRILEERVLPTLSRQIRTIAQYLGERDRESYYRLKLFKQKVAS